MNEKEVESLLKETKAILEGHFLLTSGLHWTGDRRYHPVSGHCPSAGRSFHFHRKRKWQDDPSPRLQGRSW